MSLPLEHKSEVFPLGFYNNVMNVEKDIHKKEVSEASYPTKGTRPLNRVSIEFPFIKVQNDKYSLLR